MNRALVLLASLSFLGCGGGGGHGGGGSVPTGGGPTPPTGGNGSGTPPVQPAVITSADNTVGTGTPGSVTQAALQAALDRGGTIVFNSGGAVTLALTSELRATRTATIDGASQVTLDGQSTTRIFNQSSGTTLWLQNLALRNGRAPDRGGGVFVNGGTFVAINVSFTSCQGSQSGPDIGGGAVYELLSPSCTYSGCTFTDNTGSNGGAIGSLGCDLIVFNCGFTNNRATGTPPNSGGIGGAIYMDGVHQAGTNNVFSCTGSTFTQNSATNHGGAIFTFVYPGTASSSTIVNTTFEANSVTGGIGSAGAVYHQNEALTVTGCTFSNNTATSQGAGLWLIAGSPAAITNCTFSSNRATTQGQALGGGLVVSSGPANITACTFAENFAGNFAGGLFAGSSSPVVLRNCLFWNNVGTEPFNGLNVNRSMTDGGGNMQFPAKRANGTDDTLATATSVVADSNLQALANNTGPTLTRALPAGSPAIGAGTSGGPTTDQRGRTRAAPPSIGAYEAP